MNRSTFVVQVQSDGPTTLENLSTQERVAIPDLDAVGGQIEAWLEGSDPKKPAPGMDAEGAGDE